MNHPECAVSAGLGMIKKGSRQDATADLETVTKYLVDSDSSLYLSELPKTALAYFVAHIAGGYNKPLVVVVPKDRDADALAEEIRFFTNDRSTRRSDPLSRKVWWLPSRSGHKAHRLGKTAITSQRLATLYAIKNSPAPPVVVTSALALMERLLPPKILIEKAAYHVVGEEVNIDQLVRHLVEKGYYHVSLVEEYGDFSRRGGVLDVYAPLYRWPLRFEFFGDELESIRLFHPSSQRSLGVMEDAILLPASEIILDEATRERARQALLNDVREGNLSPSAGNVWLERLEEGHQLSAFEPVLSVFYERLATLFDYLSAATMMIWSDVTHVQEVLYQSYREARQDWEKSQTQHDWQRPADELITDPDRLLRKANVFRHVWCNKLVQPDDGGVFIDLGVTGQDELATAVKSHPAREHLLKPLAEQFKAWGNEGYHCYLVCAQKERVTRLASLLNNYGLDVVRSADNITCSGDPHEIRVLSAPLRQGFLWPAESLAVVCEDEIFARKRRRRYRKSTVAGLFLNSFQDLHQGDYVVHVDHGIGVYKGLVHLHVGKIESDFLQLEYQAGDRLYVPVDRLQKVQKYLGVEGQQPNVDKLGGRSWETAKRKARESAKRIAEELLKIYAQRHVRQGHRFSPPDSLFREFETTFSFEETPDQMRAIEEVLEDMISPRPMDRLVCGDVGYGKTEVALRAAFKAIMDGKQVAMLVPTTVLAEQHFQTCHERFQNFPINVDVLSRFKTRKQQKEILAGLKKGVVDMVIGTHRLLQDDVVFKDLGLLIIDEEHRFGVKHKEKLKKLRVSVDVLTLTATPIPRTLHMSLSGIRDLSTIDTAPQDRRSVETYVCPYDELTIRDAIQRELQRGGQVFFVHNHVHSIERVAARLKKLVPQARVGVAHGQMKERQLEKVMLDFVHHNIDVLVCTTIIESGLDIPSANTIIIDRADKLGLAQIYQLRGRVGRANEQAYAYLLIPGEHLISRNAHKRLRALMDFSELGSGFKIALNDLQIRGGGTILGANQSGHISAVGYELYLDLLEKTIRELKGEETEEERVDPEISIPVAAFLPESFIVDTDQRLVAYKRLAAVEEESEIDALAKEWRDRYGPLPDSAKALLIMAKIRLLLVRLKAVKLEGDDVVMTLHFIDPLNFNEICSVLVDEPCFVQLPKPNRLVLEIRAQQALRHLARLKRILQKLYDHDSDIKSIR